MLLLLLSQAVSSESLLVLWQPRRLLAALLTPSKTEQASGQPLTPNLDLFIYSAAVSEHLPFLWRFITMARSEAISNLCASASVPP